MFDTEDSDSDVDEQTLAWIDQYPQLGLNAQTFEFLWQGAVESVPSCINGEDNIEAHAEETLTTILRASSRDDVDLIEDIQDARDLISRKQFVLEESERFSREQESDRRARQRENARNRENRRTRSSEDERIRSQRRRAQVPEDERRRSEKIRSQR